jgi:hypothetical protein
LKAREAINSDKSTHDGIAYDLVNDEVYKRKHLERDSIANDAEFYLRYKDYLK